MDNPGSSGPTPFRRLIYAAPGLAYGQTDSLQNYFIFDSPSPGFQTRTIDLSDIADFDASFPWPFDNTRVPINGIAVVPDGAGPFPLAVFAHGNLSEADHNSTPGYLYLCDLLASHGIVAATIDANFLNGTNKGEDDGRAIVHLEHLKQFRIWAGQAGHPLSGKLDFSRIMIVGHSRGGEAAGHASAFNRRASIQFDPEGRTIPVDGSGGLGPYGFEIRAVVAIAPTDQRYVPPEGPSRVADPYFVLHGSRDCDVFSFRGQLCHDRCHRVDLADPSAPAAGDKGLLWIHGAGHNYFNTEWAQESAGSITRGEQERVARVYLGAIARAYLLDQPGYRAFLARPQVAFDRGWLPRRHDLTSQFQPSARIFVQHGEEAGTELRVSAPFEGEVIHEGVAVAKLRLAREAASGPRSLDGTPLDRAFHLYQDAFGVRIEWTAPGGRYALDLGPSAASISDSTHIAFRAGQSIEPENAVGVAQDFTVAVRDASGATARFAASQVGPPLVYPDDYPRFRPQSPDEGTIFPPRTDPVTVLQTLFLPLSRVRELGVDPSDLRAIEFIFDRTPRGVIYLDDIQFATLEEPPTGIYR
jgi:dienelactone hydrolase